MSESRIVLQPWRQAGDMLEVSAQVHLAGETRAAWFRVPAEHRAAVTGHADPFVLGLLFPMMSAGDDLVVNGPVSPTLLNRLQAYMAVWEWWFPKLYRRIAIRATDERELPAQNAAGKFLCPASCGVDSTFTFLRHHHRTLGGRSVPIAAATAILGFDIPLDETVAAKEFTSFQARARALTDPACVPLIPLINNLRPFATDWPDAHITALVGTHMLLAGHYAGMLLPNTIGLNGVHCRWGSHPLLDPLLASSHFFVMDDGADVTRYDKMRIIAQWPDALHRLHVCNVASEGFENCGTCEKCIRTVLCCQAVGIDPPRTFTRLPTPRDISRLLLNHPVKIAFWDELCTGMQKAGLQGTDCGRAAHRLLARAKRRGRWREFLSHFVPLRNALRKALRGTTASKSQQHDAQRRQRARTNTGASEIPSPNHAPSDKTDQLATPS